MFRNRAIILRKLRYALVIIIHATVPAYAEQSFASVAGSWSGSGSMKPPDGPRERVRCKVEYNLKNAGHSVKMDGFPSPHANFGCGTSPIRRARSVLGQSSSRPNNPDATRMTALMVKPVK
jgi:hypothetical protein